MIRLHLSEEKARSPRSLGCLVVFGVLFFCFFVFFGFLFFFCLFFCCCFLFFVVAFSHGGFLLLWLLGGLASCLFLCLFFCLVFVLATAVWFQCVCFFSAGCFSALSLGGWFVMLLLVVRKMFWGIFVLLMLLFNRVSSSFPL